MTNAYDNTLLNKARTSFGWMFDYVVHVLGMSLKEYYQLFLDSSYADKYESGDSATVAGKSGAEVAQAVFREKRIEVDYVDPVFTMERTPEYWAGWAIAYYQWYRNISFKHINDAVCIDDIVRMYKKYHEMDIDHFVIEIDRRRKEAFNESALKRFRMYAALSQKELADKSGVPLRTIQQYEQRQKNINAARVDTVISLSKALHCAIEDILEC